MKQLNIGKLRGLQQIANDDGLFVMTAMDHRGSMQRMIDPAHPEAVMSRWDRVLGPDDQARYERSHLEFR